MKHQTAMAALALGLMPAVCWADEPKSAAGANPGAYALASDNDKVIYSLGYELGRDVGRNKLEFSPGALLQGAKDGMSGAQPLVSAPQRQALLKQIRAARAKENLEQAEAFLADNGRKEGVQTLPSGLQYRVLKAGEGKIPGPRSSVRVHYRGSLIDGTEFDSSYGRAVPATFRVSKVIKGWQESLMMMKEGAKWQLFIPPALGYGERGPPEAIPPNSVLIFEVELVTVL